MSVNITFLGGADTVTGSRFLVRHDGHSLLIDCGLFQGYKQLRLRNRVPFAVPLLPGPDGAAPASATYVAGDSAGGNLALSLIAWVRDQGLRAPDAAVALSPATDGTIGMIAATKKAAIRGDIWRSFMTILAGRAGLIVVFRPA